MKRTAEISRKTLETEIDLKINLDGDGCGEIITGLGFLDHMLMAFAKHSGIDLKLKCQGDLQVDDHHTAEDCAIVLGQGVVKALGEIKGINRFGYAYAPLDEALSRAVIDICGRATDVVNIDFQRDTIGEIATENIKHFFVTFSQNAKMSLHLDCLRGENDHHKAEACFKALAIALKQAIAKTIKETIPSTKGVL